MNKHTAELPDGTVVTINSKSRVYAYVIAVELRDDDPDSADRAWGYVGWSGTRENALKTQRTWDRRGAFKSTRLVPATLLA